MSTSARNARNPWSKNEQQNKKPRQNPINSTSKSKSEKKFQEVQEKLQAAVKKHVKEYDSSSEEEELESNTILESILKTYHQTGASNNGLQRTQEIISDTFSSGTTTCLICISSIKRNESVWNCGECYCMFHLSCIQRWSKDTIVQQKQALEGPIVVSYKKEIAWGCPKCRQEYGPNDIPTTCTCFCKKAVNPQFQPFLVPHSCGEICGKNLKPHCGHGCVLLCHPGPCPPCPQMVTVTCYCGVKPPQPQRCCNKEWSCGSSCNKLLACKKHKCSQRCHEGDCEPCAKKSIQKCICGSNSKLRNCATPMWQCDKVCNKPLECGFHKCLEVCHIGGCDSCALSKPRTCACGKSIYNLPCTEETPTCEDTCGKMLECGVHPCNQRCHKDNCGTCFQTVTKVCRCGLHTKDVQCRKIYLCDTKCKEIKDCNKHPCNRKCCDKNCSPCEKPCGRTLSCGNHKCTSICHRGPCYPCNLTESVSCCCGKTSITVPCGRKQKTKPPKCNKLCFNPPNCHHLKREDHRCHFGDCPPCKQICNQNRTNCSHKCPASCHSAVLVKVEFEKPSMPWEQVKPQLELKALPCPNCVVDVPMTCLGKHETSNFPCYMARVSSCGRTCRRLMDCGNHQCTQMCHLVENAKNELLAGINCEKCEKSCEKPRPEGCQHICFKPCHPGACPPCKQMIRLKCHCGLNQPYVLCSTWTSIDNKEELQTCGDRCPKNYECGHRCRSNCHSGPCVTSELCKKKIKVTCNCRRIKKDFTCEMVKSKLAIIECDETCLKKQEEEKKLKDKEEEIRKKEEELKNKIELEKFEKKFQGKKRYKEKRVLNESDNRSFIQKNWVMILSLMMLVISIMFYCLLL